MISLKKQKAKSKKSKKAETQKRKAKKKQKRAKGMIRKQLFLEAHFKVRSQSVTRESVESKQDTDIHIMYMPLHFYCPTGFSSLSLRVCVCLGHTRIRHLPRLDNTWKGICTYRSPRFHLFCLDMEKHLLGPSSLASV